MTSWIEGYPATAGVYDEMLDAAGKIRPAWQGVVDAFAGLGPDDAARRRRQAEQLLKQNGVVLNVYGEGSDGERAWPLDLVPLALSEEEWSRIEKGIAQRARLLDLLLNDFYGARRSLQEGLVPARLVLRHLDLFDPCHGVDVPGGRRLVLYAADLIRGPDGQWRVGADRTQAPAGSGYALENRIALSRALPEAMRENQVRRHAPYFAAMRQGLWRLAPWSDNPRVVVLTPGPRNEAYFEHAYLARYLGFTLVEGGDLIARDGRVWLKTLGGLEAVDVVMRRLDDDYVDPLEFRIELTIGVPGMMEAIRGGRLAMANALGSGAVEMPGLAPHLPALAKAWLSEDLILSSLEGQVERPHLVPSTMPAIVDGRFRPRPVTLRVFAAATADGGYSVMPGGLLRILGTAGSADLSMQHGAESKDCWVLSSGPVEPFSLLGGGDGALEIREASADLPGRVADNLFWLGRYAERSEGAIRALRSALMRLTDGATPADLAPIGRYLWRQGLIGNPATASLVLFERALIGAISDPASKLGLIADLDRLARVMRMVEDRLSLDMIRILRQLQRLADDAVAHPEMLVAEALGGLDRMVTTMAAFNGLEMENMTRGQGWRFLDLGRRIERALVGATIVEATLAHEDGARVAALDFVLELADSAMTYRSRYFAAPQFAPALHLVLLDPTNPRSVAYQVAAISRHVEALPRHQASGRPTAERGLAQKALKLLKDADLVPLGRPGADGQRPELRRLLGEVEEFLRGVSDAVSAHFFGHGFAHKSFLVQSAESGR